MPTNPLPRLRALCLDLPETFEREAWGSPTFRVTKGKIFAMYAGAEQPNGKGRPQVWINSSKINQELLIAEAPTRYFSPPYVGVSGWVGVWLDRRPPWGAIRGLLEDGWRRAAPKRLVRELAPTAVTTSRR